MVTQLKFNPHWTQLLGQALGEGGAAGIEGYQQGREAKQKQLQAEQEKEQVRDFYRSKDMDPALADQPQFIQSAILNKFLKPKTWMESLGAAGAKTVGMQPQQRVGAAPQGQNPNVINVDGQNVDISTFSPETQQALKLVQAEEAGPTSLTRLGASAATSFGVPAAAKYLSSLLGPTGAALISAGTVADLGLKGANWLGEKFGAEGNILPTYEELQNRERERPGGYDRYSPGMQTYLKDKDKQNPLKLLPTFSQMTQAAREGGEALGLPTKPKSAFEKQMSAIAEVGGHLSDPSSWTGALSTAKDVGKAVTYVAGAKFAGNLVEELTGSNLLKNVTEGILYSTYSIWPGLMSNMANNYYGQFDKALKGAEEAGVSVNMQPYRNAYNKIGKEIESVYPMGSAERNALQTQFNQMGEMFLNKEGVLPSALHKSTKIAGKLYNKIPDQAKDTFQKMTDLQRKALTTTMNAYKPGSGKLLTIGNELYSKNAKVFSDLKGLKSQIPLRNLGLGTLAMVFGAGKPFLAGAAGYAGIKYASAMLRSPTVQATMKQLAKANALGNAGAISTLSNKLNKEAENIIRKMPKEDQDKIRKVAQEAKKNIA